MGVGSVNWIAGMERDPLWTERAPLYRVWVLQAYGEKLVVMEAESYMVTSQLTDAINAKLGVPGPCSTMGAGVVWEIDEVASAIVTRIKGEKGKEEEVKGGSGANEA